MEKVAIGMLALALSACAAVVDPAVLSSHTLLPTAIWPGARRPVVHDPKDLRRGMISVSEVGYDECAVRLDGEELGHTPLIDEPITLGGHTLVVSCDHAPPMARSFELSAEWRLELTVRRARPLPGQLAQAIVAERRLGPDPESRRRRHDPAPDPRALVVLASLHADFPGGGFDDDPTERQSLAETAGLQQ